MLIYDAFTPNSVFKSVLPVGLRTYLINQYVILRYCSSNLCKWNYLYGALPFFTASLVAQRLKRVPAMQATWVWSLGREVPLEKEMATHSSILAWRIPRTEESGGLKFMGSQRVRHNWVTSLHFALAPNGSSWAIKGLTWRRAEHHINSVIYID